MRLLFVDDDPEHVEAVSDLLRDALGAEITVASTVDAAVEAAANTSFDLVITDIFIPLSHGSARALGPRARRYRETVQHLGGLVLLDELDRLDPAPRVLAHTACTDFALIEILGERVEGRVPKPAPVDVLLRAIMEAMGLRAPRF